MINFWRTLCSFDANGGATHVDGRVHFELAETEEEAKSATRKYLESWGYLNIDVYKAWIETWDEKYKKPRVYSVEPGECVDLPCDTAVSCAEACNGAENEKTVQEAPKMQTAAGDELF